MLIRNSIFSTKKFFKKTLHTLKSLFTGGSDYRRIPKTSPYNKPIQFDMMKNRSELDNFYSDFTDRWDHKGKKIKKKITPAAIKQGKDEIEKGSLEYGGNSERIWKERGSNYSMERRRRAEIEKKLKEIEMMDKSNVEHVLDIEEVIHYYSRLTCPAYLDIVDKFLMDMYADIFSQFTPN